VFIDEIKVYARAGHGGKGCVAFRREKYRPKGGPAGGNGGRGGDVILQADNHLNNLIAQYYEPRLIAKDGQHGLGRGMDGAAGNDLIVKVPCGTVVWRLVGTGGRLVRVGAVAAPRPGPAHPKGELIADLTEAGQQFLLCKGGRGGLGNRNFATSRLQAPRFAQPGGLGEEGDFLLELRIIADVGLVGYPNAGKSTLLKAISHARPKIAPYPFTTLHPQIGIIEYPDFYRLTVCDVPGLIEGAHRNVGLGHAFLRHIERCKILVLLLDMAGTDGRAPWDDYRQLLSELGLYDPALLEKPRLIVANKMDQPVAEENLKKFKRRIRKKSVLPIAAAFDQGVEEFKKSIRGAVQKETSL
jgi:GTP-binding protein